MDIILLERIENLGTIGDVVSVKDGYARNYLLPQKKALRANEANKQVFEANRDRLEKENAERRSEAEKAGEKVDGAEVVLIRASSNSGQLYGSVAGRDVADAINAEGGKVERSMVVLDKPIKTLGLHEVKVRLHAEVTVTVTLNIARSQDEADRQARGENVINAQFEEERVAAEQAAADMLEGGAGHPRRRRRPERQRRRRFRQSSDDPPFPRIAGRRRGVRGRDRGGRGSGRARGRVRPHARSCSAARLR